MKKLLKLLGYLSALCLVLYGSQKLPEYHDYKLREHVQTKVVKVTNFLGTSGGTGFYVNAPSGKVFIMTNAHVCEVKLGDMVFIYDEALGRSVPRRIVEQSPNTDLCLIEAGPNDKGLDLAKDYYRNEKISVFGYPRLMNKVRYDGELFHRLTVSIPDYLIRSEEDEKRCSLPKNFIDEVDLGFFTVKGCFIKVNATATTVQVLPGNSGSPAVNYDGNLIGVVFAGNEANWGFLVDLADVKLFLKAY